MESWRLVWRNGFVPAISTAGLAVLREALANDDPRLIQGYTTSPPPLMSHADLPVTAADALAYIAWQEHGLITVGATEEAFAELCFEVDERLGEPAACRFFLNWFDDTPRDEMRRELLSEVEQVLAERQALAVASACERCKGVKEYPDRAICGQCFDDLREEAKMDERDATDYLSAGHSSPAPF